MFPYIICKLHFNNTKTCSYQISINKKILKCDLLAKSSRLLDFDRSNDNAKLELSARITFKLVILGKNSAKVTS